MELLKNLNEQQKKAVTHKDGPILVVAGAGAGKTRIITCRVANLIRQGVPAQEILAVTFTNKAANEMKERVRSLLNSKLLPAVGTFHSICARILRENAHKASLAKNFTILDKEDSLKIIKKNFKQLDINPKQFQPAKILTAISREKANLVRIERYAEEAGDDLLPKTISLIWQEYEGELKKQNSADFDDLITKVVFLFRENQEILQKYQEKWKYIMIDEYQDTNHAQYIFSKLLAQKYKNICCVGDEDQSIYAFRGADFGNILNFEKDWPGAKIVMLEQNYRSAKNIISAANAVISRNKFRKEKKLFSEIKDGKPLSLFDALDEKQEAIFIGQKSFELIRGGLEPENIAVLYRANFQSRAIEEALLNLGLPYQVVGTRFFERKEIKDILAYLRATINPNDIISIERIINEPPRGIGKVGLASFFAGKKIPESKELSIKNFFSFLKKCEQVIAEKIFSSALLFIFEKSGYKNYLNDGTEEGLARSENIRELLMLSKKYDYLKPPFGAEKFLEEMALMSEQDSLDDTTNATKEQEKNKGIRLMTVHAAKGLEFPCVFVTGLEEGLFPYARFASGPVESEEERRLFYVALTRAKETVFLSFAYNRTFFGGRQSNKPSRFIYEIPPELLSGAENASETNYLEYN